MNYVEYREVIYSDRGKEGRSFLPAFCVSFLFNIEAFKYLSSSLFQLAMGRLGSLLK